MPINKKQQKTSRRINLPTKALNSFQAYIPTALLHVTTDVVISYIYNMRLISD